MICMRLLLQRVGNERLRGISGGEKKRLMAGEALVSLAQLCFCDEAISGAFYLCLSSPFLQRQGTLP